jgi:hypothetical protein
MPDEELVDGAYYADAAVEAWGSRARRTSVQSSALELINEALSNHSLPGRTVRTLPTALDELLQLRDQLLNTF